MKNNSLKFKSIFKTSIIFLSVLSSIILNSISFSQDFYQKDFAKNPLDSNNKPNNSNSNKNGLKKSGGPNEVGNLNGSAENNSTETNKNNAIKVNNRINRDKYTAQNVISVSAIINGTNRKYFADNFKDFVKVSRKNNFFVKNIFIIALPEYQIAYQKMLIQSDPSLRVSIEYGMRTKFVESLPQKYSNVKSTPAWIVETDEGEIIVEGNLPFRDLFDQNMQFIDGFGNNNK